MKTLQQHLGELLAHSHAAGRSPHTLKMIRHAAGHLLRWLEETHGVAVPERLAPIHLETWAGHLAGRRTRQGLPLRPLSIAKYFETARVFLHWLAKQGAVPAQFAEAVPRRRENSLLPVSVLTHPQVDRLLTHLDTGTAAGFQRRAMMELLYSSGIRPAELLGLDLRDVDLAERVARVLGKGRKERVVPMGETASRFLESYLRSVRPQQLRDPAEQALWLNRKGQRMRYHTLRHELAVAVAPAGLPVTVTSYTFRRSCATEMIRGGANIYLVALLLGHANTETLRRYVRLVIPDLKLAHAKCHPRERGRRGRRAEPADF